LQKKEIVEKLEGQAFGNLRLGGVKKQQNCDGCFVFNARVDGCGRLTSKKSNC
jgi:hypothetical protein